MKSVFYLCALLSLLGASACASKAQTAEPPIITSATYQHTLYNGKAQPIAVAAAKDHIPPFIVTYFTSEENLERDAGGSVEPPTEVGDYYARIERPSGNGYKRGENIKVEYHIQKAFISFTADSVQRFTHDGEPKEAAAHTAPPVELSVTYFSIDGESLASPPVEKGRYRVVLVFSGNKHYIGASKEIELWIE
ncbi:MAG: MBG domain-containing protein [Treponema sp.]|jgi:hypothetical protein|nr:MBG domain-containing protein [Treponema sp.]